MMIHSLQQFFSNANVLRAKYGYDPERYTLEVQAQLIERQGLEFSVILQDVNRKHAWTAGAFAKRPESALGIFERQLAQNTGKILDDMIFEVPDEDEEEEL
jgi:hypothetical protein